MIPSLYRVGPFVERYTAFTEGGIRYEIFNEDNNGMAELGVVVRKGRSVFINEERYFLLLELKNTGEIDPVLQLLRAAKKEGRYLTPEEAVDRVRGRSDVALGAA